MRGRGGPGDEHALFEERLAWERALGAAGWTCLSWPQRVRRPGRDAAPAGDLLRGVRPGRRSGPGRDRRRGADRPDDPALRDRRAEARGSCRRSRAARSCGARATPSRTPARTSRTSRPVPSSWSRLTATSGSSSGQKVWTSLAHWAAVVLRARAHRSRRAAPPRHLVPPRADGPARHRDPADRADHRRLGVQRGLLRRRADSGRSRRRRGQRRLEGRDGHARVRAGRAHARSAARVRERVARDRRRGARASGSRPDPVLRQRLAQAWIELEIMRYTAMRGLTAMAKGEVTRETSICEALLGHRCTAGSVSSRSTRSGRGRRSPTRSRTT